MIGLEPTRLAAPDPKSGASANFATSAIENIINWFPIITLLDCAGVPREEKRAKLGFFS